MTFQELLKSREEEFYKELIEMSPLHGRDMHNRPPLYETTFDKVDEIKSFNRESMIVVVEFIIGEVEGMKEPGLIVNEFYSGFNAALSDIIIKLEQAKKEIK